ncbi:hypothetical protein CDD82_7776 [Ophiocordyceps australis]|uniref:DNA damage-responsive protein 48 n=1 Tax=Ophiocordyceps australis TaxID=1399860 RepID=A0A2C5YR85_9HYPO|nr:hypothetical protein CDD82_7776 [Ophiocordyceps australis]
MDFVNKLSSAVGDGNKDNKEGDKKQSGSGGLVGKLNNMAGGGKQGEENEDGLDKAVDFVQEKFLGQGDQSNESAAEQAKDEAISDYIRDKYKSTTGSDFPIPDKEKKMGL